MRELKRILGSNMAYDDANNNEQNLYFTAATSTIKCKDASEGLMEYVQENAISDKSRTFRRKFKREMPFQEYTYTYASERIILRYI
jgi:hypothetical protein